jgi:SAM-dependent methyltransferase
MTYTFTEQKREWSRPPVDDVGYIPALDLLKMRPEEFLELVRQAEENRYSGWRNWNNLWWTSLRLGGTFDKTVLDYGCGIGIEGMQYARGGNEVIAADIVRDNVKVAMRWFQLEGYPLGAFHITKEHPVSTLFGKFDVIHCSGVLHHIPNPEPVVEALSGILKDDGELRLMVYSDFAWRQATGTEPPRDVSKHPRFVDYYEHWDAVGKFADWYDDARLEERFGEWFELEEVTYLTVDRAYLAAILRKR